MKTKMQISCLLFAVNVILNLSLISFLNTKTKQQQQFIKTDSYKPVMSQPANS